ncbi:MAG: histidine--tRNA ligase [Acidimicrobiia bacterium]|nr:histidine--tRNA ligase [Acidimicrobiia bacterium]NNL98896.1 histidine--tRNA ligase [Acidimicrobiia bacterium]
MTFRPPKGTDDILPPASQAWRRVLGTFDSLAERYGYELAITPIFEATEVFERGVGEGTDVVQKEMYTFEDKGGRSLTLRPEATASMVRAYLGSGSQTPMKLAYSGPMFRYERPQAGRRRQFWQVGVEYLGEDAAGADIEVIELGYRFYQDIGLEGLEVQLNSLGDPADRAGYRSALVDFLTGIADRLSDDSRRRIDTNPLRVFDSKQDRDKLAGAPLPIDYLSDAARAHYEQVTAGLEEAGIPFSENGLLVRGLDYYTRTVFEYVATGLDAAQNAVGGGGRYDGLAEALGGRHVPAVGFSLGVDRILLAMGEGGGEPAPLDAFVVVADEARRAAATGLVRKLRETGLRADIEPGARSVKAQFRAADRRRATAAIVVGDEWDDGEVTLRLLESGDEQRVGNDAETISTHIGSETS